MWSHLAWDSEVSVIKIDRLESLRVLIPFHCFNIHQDWFLLKAEILQWCHDTFYLKTFHYPNTDSNHKISTKEIDVTLLSVNFIEL